MPHDGRHGSAGRDRAGSDSDAVHEVDDAEIEEDLGDFASIDKLLSETDAGWDLEAQVVTLKEEAAASRPSLVDLAPMRPRLASKPVAIPTPFELAPTQVPVTMRGSTAAGPTDVASSSPLLTRAKAPPRAPLPPPRKPGASISLRTPEPSPVRVPNDMASPEALVDLLHARIATLEASGERVSLSRAHVEMAIASEAILGDDARAVAHAEQALRVEPGCSAAHALLRRKQHGRQAIGAMLAHLEAELLAATGEAHRVELLAEKARLLEASGDRSAEVRATWEQVLAHAPNHPGALAGLESELASRAMTSGAPGDWEALAVHLALMAQAYASDTRLAAWVHVERAQILERRLGRVDAARGALERALELDPSVGPVRDALLRHVAARGDWAALARLLEEEARIESSVARAARLELDAGAVLSTRMGDPDRAALLLERASGRSPTVPLVDRRVLDELVRLHEAAGHAAEAARARRARLRYVTDPGAIAWELRALSLAAEREGDLDSAIADVQRALSVDATDPTLVDQLDRLLAAAGKHEQRVATWLQEAARTEDGVARSKALARAAQICDAMGRPADAVRHMRSAWIAHPGEPEVLDALARLLAPVMSEAVDAGARSLVELYAQAADHAHEPERRLAYLDRAALLWEELIGDPARAAQTYEQILSLDPDRRSAMLGLERTAARLGDARLLSRALLDEARLSVDGGTRLALKARAATALARTDPSRAMGLLREVLREDPSHAAARLAESRLEEEAGRWDLAARSLRARIEAASTPAEKVSLWLALAQLQNLRLRKPLDAMQSLEAARALDPTHPVPPEEVARVLEDHGDVRELRDAVERLATSAPTAEQRARHLARAAEIDELRLGDDASAARTYARALSETPDDELVAERLERVLARRALQPGGAGLAELAALLARRIERASSPGSALTLSFELSSLLVELDKDSPRATALLESVLAEQADHVPALRTLAALRRRSGELAPLARVLSRQGDELKDLAARLGSLWRLAALEEWKLPVGDPSTTYRLILDLDPTDPGALEASLRRELPSARRGDPRARKTAIGALRALVPFASDDDSRLALQLRLALLLETSATEAQAPGTADELAREALDRYRDALRVDELSVSAATGVARLAGRLQDAESAFAASRSLAELAIEPRVRARYLVDAAEILLGPDEERLGPVAERRARAGAMLERALEADPDSISAAGRLATLLLEERQGERLVAAFRVAIGRAKSPDAVVMLGSEIARVGRDELEDLTIAIDAMRKVRAVAPQHVPSLLTLAELCIAQRAWPEAVDALESVVSTSREAPPKLTALFALASIYEKVLGRPGEVERVLRAALSVDPQNPRALRGLLRRLAAGPNEDERAERARREEIAELLTRLASVEKDAEQKTGILLELAEVQQRVGDGRAAERALIEAVAVSPSNARAFARLGGLYRRTSGRDDVGHARALAAVIALGQELGAVDARWLAALGQLEIHALNRLRDGIAHLRRAVALDPGLYETRFELASAFSKVGAHDEATRTLQAMLTPSAQPILSIADPAAGLSLLEESLSGERRLDEAIVVSELRALAGELDDGRSAWLRGRRLPPLDAAHGVLDRPTLVTHVLPPEGRHILLEVAAAIAGIEAKVARSDLSELGLSSRDRVGARDRHPTRALLDRVTRQLGVGEVELAIAPQVSRTRVLAQDVPWVVVPPSLTEQPEMTQLAALARAVARIAYGVPWLEEMPGPRIEALLVAAARFVVPGYAVDDLDVLASKLVAQIEPAVTRALGRRQKKVLEELAPHIAAPASRVPPIDAWVAALGRAELRAAFLVTGDLLGLLDDLRAADPGLRGPPGTSGPQALGLLLAHPYAGDLARFAMTSEATALRRRLGSIWTK